VTQPALAKTALPATASPTVFTAPPPPPPGAVVVAGGAVCDGGFSPAFASSFFSRPKTNTAASIATKNATHTTRYQPSPLPGKFGFRRGRTKDEISAKTMNAAPTTPSPILWPVERPATTGAIVESIRGGKLPELAGGRVARRGLFEPRLGLAYRLELRAGAQVEQLVQRRRDHGA